MSCNSGFFSLTSNITTTTLTRRCKNPSSLLYNTTKHLETWTLTVFSGDVFGGNLESCGYINDGFYPRSYVNTTWLTSTLPYRYIDCGTTYSDILTFHTEIINDTLYGYGSSIPTANIQRQVSTIFNNLLLTNSEDVKIIDNLPEKVKIQYVVQGVYNQGFGPAGYYGEFLLFNLNSTISIALIVTEKLMPSCTKQLSSNFGIFQGYQIVKGFLADSLWNLSICDLKYDNCGKYSECITTTTDSKWKCSCLSGFSVSEQYIDVFSCVPTECLNCTGDFTCIQQNETSYKCVNCIGFTGNNSYSSSFCGGNISNITIGNTFNYTSNSNSIVIQFVDDVSTSNIQIETQNIIVDFLGDVNVTGNVVISSSTSIYIGGCASFGGNLTVYYNSTNQHFNTTLISYDCILQKFQHIFLHNYPNNTCSFWDTKYTAHSLQIVQYSNLDCSSNYNTAIVVSVVAFVIVIALALIIAIIVNKMTN
jgi:hypothetical protein